MSNKVEEFIIAVKGRLLENVVGDFRWADHRPVQNLYSVLLKYDLF